MRWALSVLVAGLFAVVCLAPRGGESPRAGCLWDRDTLAQEAKGKELIVKAITGRFDRFEPVYYEARLRHLRPLLEAEPTRLDLYDDVGVALDRLHRGDEAIAVMAGKRAQLDLLEEGSAERTEHEYRYLANLGTFYAHRWLRNGKDRADLADLQEAERLIAAAIELNPEAHFGRERYQLMAIRWLLDPPAPNSGWLMTHLLASAAPEGEAVGMSPRGRLKSAGYADAAEGLAGLAVLGDGWESPDLYLSLAAALTDRGDGYLAVAAYARFAELMARPGYKPLIAGVGADDEMLQVSLADRAYQAIYVDEHERHKVDAWYAEARAEAESWRAARNRYVSERIESGEVPAAEGSFWAAWVEPSQAPPMPERLWPWWTPYAMAVVLYVLLPLGVLIAALVAFKRFAAARANRAALR